MAFMELQIHRKGALYSAECRKCGTTHYTHEWTTDDHCERRDAMQAGTLRCDECPGTVDPETFTEHKRSYAGRYSAPGYLDCTDWEYGPNKRKLATHLRELYGPEEQPRDALGRFCDPSERII